MGQSTDAILVFGIPFEEEEVLPEFMRDFDDFDAFVDDAMGIPPWGEPGRPDYPTIVALRATYPVTLVSHCSGDYPMYILAVPGTEITANRGTPHVFVDGFPVVDLGKYTKLLSWAEAHNIEGTGRWILCSNWN